MAGVLGAIASNAGDYFHFTYAVRRMLDMLHPRSSLKRIELEGINPSDLPSADDVNIVDVSEYFGGDTFTSATKVVISQLKYSYANATQNWTLSDICRNDKDASGSEKPRTSLIGELAQLFEQYLDQYGETAIGKLQLQIFTNRPLQPDLRQQLGIILNALDNTPLQKFPSTLGKLSRIDPQLGPTLNQLQDATSFSNQWKNLGLFLQAINWEAFDQPDIDQQKRQAFEIALAFAEDFSDDWFRRLLAFVIETARSKQVRGISERDVCITLGVSEKLHFFPAQYHPEPSNLESYQSTQSYSELLANVDEMSSGFLLLHGRGGIGKSTVIQHFAETYQLGHAVPVYAAWAGQPGDERYPLQIFLTQVTNELDHLYETNILAITNDDVRSLKLRFRKALAVAASIARSRGHKLVLIVDAADEAVKQYHEYSTKRFQVEDLFLDVLFGLQLPENCVCAVSTRTENIQLLKTPLEVARIEIKGFDLTQTADYARSQVPELSDQAIELLHEHSEGIPRVINKTLEIGQKEHVSDWIAHIVRYAKAPLESLYVEAMADVARDMPYIRQLLSIFQELQGPVSVSLLAAVISQTPETIESILSEKVYFGLFLNQLGHVAFTDKNFEDFTRQYVLSSENDAKQHIADFCKDTFPDDYAINHIVYHFYRANRFHPLVTHLLAHFEDHVSRLSPFPEDFLRDLKYGLMAAANTDQHLEGMQLLVHASALAHGGDVFAEVLESFVDIAVEYGYQHRLVDHIEKTVFENDKPKHLLTIAAELARSSKEPDLASELVWRSQQNIQRKSSYFDSDSQGIRWDSSEILPFVLYTCFDLDLKSGLEKLLDWHPEEDLYALFTEVIKLYKEVNQDDAIVDTIESANLSEIQKGYALLGWIAAHRHSSLDTLDSVLKRLIPCINEVFSSTKRNLDYAGDIVLNLMASQVSTDNIQQFLPYWRPKQLYEHDFSHYGLYTEEVNDFLRRCAVKETLQLETFDPNQFVFTETPTQNDYQKDERTNAARRILATHYRVILAHVNALRNGSSWDDLSFTKDVIEHWKDDYYSYSRTSKSRFVNYVCVTLEAIVACPEPYIQIVQDIVAFAESYLSNGSVSVRPRFIKVLAQKEEYYVVCEGLITRQLDDINAGRIASGERVEEILQMCTVLRSMKMNEQAYEAFLIARNAANHWDRFGFGRSLSLIATADAVQRSGQSLTPNQSINLLDIFDYVNDILGDERGSLFEDALTTVSRDHLDIVFGGLRRAESRGHIHLGTGLAAVAKAMQGDTEILWPLMHIMKHLDVTLLLKLVEDHKGTIDLPDFLAKLAWRIRIETNIDSQIRNMRKLIGWTELNGLSDEPTTQQIRHYLNKIELFAEEPHSGYSANQSRPSKLIFSSDPITALNEIKTKLSSDDRLDISLLHAIRDSLRLMTNDQKAELVEMVVGRDLDSAPPYSDVLADSEVFVLLVDVAESIGAQPYFVTSLKKVRQSLLVFADRHLQSLFAYYYDDSEREKALRIAHSPAIDNNTFFKAVLRPVATELTQLTADRMYTVIAFLANRLGNEAQVIFQMLLERALDAVNPGSEDLSAIVNEDQDLLDFLFDYLGDPQVELCWCVAHSIVDMTIHAPNVLLPRVLKRARDTSHDRWMSIRDWLLLIVHHIALRRPDFLLNYMDELVFHALDDEFPHAKIREHAKQSILAVEGRHPGIVDQEMLERIKKVNGPVYVIARTEIQSDDEIDERKRNHPVLDFADAVTDAQRESEKVSQDGQFRFYFIDNSEGWFGDLAKRFGRQGEDVANAAMRWIRSWNITDDMCTLDQDRLRKRFGNNINLGRYKFDSPPITSLRTYVEYHCVHLVAGEWIDSNPVHVNDENWSYGSWHDWVVNNIYDVDPALISRLVDNPPLNPQNFGIRPIDFQQWVSLETSKDFFEVLEPQQYDANWLVVSEYSQAVFYDYQLSIHVNTATVAQETATALARAISTEPSDGYVGLPEFELEHETKLHMIEEALSGRDLRIDLNLSFGNTDELLVKHPLFEIHPLTVYWTVSEDMGQFDSYWPEESRSLRILSPDVMKTMNLERVPLTLDYSDNQGLVVGRFETWYSDHYRNEFRSSERYAKGTRFLLDKNTLNAYLQKTKRSLVLKVNISRKRPYSYDKGRDSDIWGKTYGFIYDVNGRLTLC
ncbi:MAG: NACHT domain-containing protein [Anaerolineae bacterium]|nr:NACHT domain-containing protein [Anaerolineae bacterium]